MKRKRGKSRVGFKFHHTPDSEVNPLDLFLRCLKIPMLGKWNNMPLVLSWENDHGEIQQLYRQSKAKHGIPCGESNLTSMSRHFLSFFNYQISQQWHFPAEKLVMPHTLHGASACLRQKRSCWVSKENQRKQSSFFCVLKRDKISSECPFPFPFLIHIQSPNITCLELTANWKKWKQCIWTSRTAAFCSGSLQKHNALVGWEKKSDKVSINSEFA